MKTILFEKTTIIEVKNIFEYKLSYLEFDSIYIIRVQSTIKITFTLYWWHKYLKFVSTIFVWSIMDDFPIL